MIPWRKYRRKPAELEAVQLRKGDVLVVDAPHAQVACDGDYLVKEPGRPLGIVPKAIFEEHYDLIEELARVSPVGVVEALTGPPRT